MKKFIAMVFTLILSLIACVPAIFAEGRSMSNEEQNAFVTDISLKVIIPFLREIKPMPFLKVPHDALEEKGTPTETLADLMKYFEDGNDYFDSCLGIDRTPFRDSIEKYYNHVLDTKYLVGCPLCCRGLTSFVIKKLMDKGIDCRYVKLTTKDGEIHDVAQYKVGDDWYICDLCKAMNLYVLDTYLGDREVLKNAKIEHLGNSEKSCIELLKMPVSEYRRLFCRAGSPWKEMKLTEENLNADTILIRDHGLDLDMLKAFSTGSPSAVGIDPSEIQQCSIQ